MNSANKNTEDLLNELFEFKSDDQEIDHKAHMIAFRFLSEIQKLVDNQDLKRKDLAEKINVSASFLTQIFKGDKLPSFPFLAKIEKAFGIEFDVKLKGSLISYENLSEDELQKIISQYNTMGKGLIAYHRIGTPDYSQKEPKMDLKERANPSEFEIIAA